MLAKAIPGTTRILAKDQPEFKRLHIRDEITDDGFNMMSSLWEPTPQELANLRAGGSVILSIIGKAHPPVHVGVANPADDAADLYNADVAAILSYLVHQDQNGMSGGHRTKAVFLSACRLTGVHNPEALRRRFLGEDEA